MLKMPALYVNRKEKEKVNADILKQVNTHQALILIKSAGLRKKYEDILIMRYVDDLSCMDIADKKQMEVESIRNLVWKARKQFDKFTEG